MFVVEGVVVKGQQLGRKLGFPTANIEPRTDIDLPNGVYVSLIETNSEEAPHRAISNLGENPTVGGCRRRLETHVLDRSCGELYGRSVRIFLLKHLRPEQAFSDIESLRKQIELDVESARSYFESHTTRAEE